MLSSLPAASRTSRARSPCEVEVLRDREGKYHLIEINPRFPAWVYLSAAAGQNLPEAVVALAMGQSVELPDYKAGIMFVRISIDQVADIRDFQSMVTAGEVTRSETHTEGDNQ